MGKGFHPDKDIPDLSGKVILVTGGNAGIGASIVKLLAAHNPARLYVCARSPKKAQELIDTIHNDHPKANLEALQLDLNSFDSIKACAAAFNEKSDRLDLLYLNAGVASTAEAVTKEGYENQFGINHVGHALFTQLIMPKLLETQKQAGSDVRIIITSSIAGHRFAPKGGIVADLDTQKSLDGGLGSTARYGHSKLANMLFARKLAQVYPQIISASFHPGTVKSGIWGKADGQKMLGYILSPVIALAGVDCDTGAGPGLWLGTTQRTNIENGRYYELGTWGKPKDGSPHAVDQKLTDRLWEWTNKELKQHGAPGWPQA